MVLKVLKKIARIAQELAIINAYLDNPIFI
jgi:hypothetical protein